MAIVVVVSGTLCDWVGVINNNIDMAHSSQFCSVHSSDLFQWKRKRKRKKHDGRIMRACIKLWNQKKQHRKKSSNSLGFGLGFFLFRCFFLDQFFGILGCCCCWLCRNVVSAKVKGTTAGNTAEKKQESIISSGMWERYEKISFLHYFHSNLCVCEYWNFFGFLVHFFLFVLLLFFWVSPFTFHKMVIYLIRQQQQSSSSLIHSFIHFYYWSNQKLN